VSWTPSGGAVAALRRLREAGLPLVLVTNTISRTRASIAAALSGAGFVVTEPLSILRYVVKRTFAWFNSTNGCASATNGQPTCISARAPATGLRTDLPPQTPHPILKRVANLGGRTCGRRRVGVGLPSSRTPTS